MLMMIPQHSKRPQPWIRRSMACSHLLLLVLICCNNNLSGVLGLNHQSDHLNLFVDADHFPFLHGVASADPLEDKVLLWTRVTPSNQYSTSTANPQPQSTAVAAVAKVEWRIWEKTPDIANLDKETLWDTTTPLQQGIAKTSAETDYTVTIDVTGLQPDKQYYYQFQDATTTVEQQQQQQRRRSVVGSTKTISKQLDEVNIAVLSCTSLWSGYFNLYRHLAKRTDIEVILHLGDFIYPELDPDELYRVPYGLCPYTDWFSPQNSFQGSPQSMMGAALSGVSGKPQDNLNNPYLVDMLENFPYCQPIPNEHHHMNNSATDHTTIWLERYRWMYNLYLMDPDLRLARQNHPMVVQFDNHDLGDDLPSLEYELQTGQPGAVQAGLEWVPQRVRHNTNIQGTNETTSPAAWDEDGVLSTDLLRRFQYGKDNLVDIIVMDTASYSGGAELKNKHGMLGYGQRQWLQNVLTNSTQTGYTWRILGSGKAFMPVTINKLGYALSVPFGMLLGLIIVVALLLVGLQVILLWCRGGTLFFLERERARSLEMDLLTRHDSMEDDNVCNKKILQDDGTSASSTSMLDFSEDQDEEDEPKGQEKAATMKEVLHNVRKAHQQSPPLLRRCSLFCTRGVVVWPILAVLAAFIADHFVNPKHGGLFNFDNHPVVWAGQHSSVTRFFDLLDSTGADTNNVWVTGDTHLCYASDVFRYDPTGKDLLEYNPNKDDVKRYGVEFLPCSGTRGNLDEMIGSILPMCHPKYALSRLSSFLSHIIVLMMNRHFRYFNGDNHGYGVVRVSRSNVETTFYQFPILEVTDEYITKTMVVRHGTDKWE